MITFDKVTKKFPLGNIAFEEVSFDIEENEFVFLVGPSGSGKTTVIKLIIKEIPPSSGTIIVDGLDISDKKFNQVTELRRKVGIVFQDFKIIQDKNVFENIALGLKIIDYPLKKIKEEVKEKLRFVNLEEKANLFPAQLSAGELQRVAIARALIGNRKIILADEPTGNLDPKTSWEIMKIFKKIEGKKTIIIATHNTDIVNSLQKRVLVLKNNRLIKDLSKGGYEI